MNGNDDMTDHGPGGKGRPDGVPGEGGVAQDAGFFRNTIVRTLLSVAFLMNVATWLVLLFAVSPKRGTVILHYNVYLGVDMVGPYGQVFLVPAIGLLFLVVNGFLAAFLYNSWERIAAYMLLLAGTMIEFGVLIASISVALVNF